MSGSGGWPGSCRKLRCSVVDAGAAPDVPEPAAAVAAVSVLPELPPQALSTSVSGRTRTNPARAGRLRASDVRMFLLIKGMFDRQVREWPAQPVLSRYVRAAPLPAERGS